MIKKFILHIALLAAVVFTSVLTMNCAGVMPPVSTKHTVDINVMSTDADVISVDESDWGMPQEYKLPDSPELLPSSMMKIDTKGQHAFLMIYAGLSVSDVKNLWQDIMYLAHKTDIQEVKLFINSPGGCAFSGLALADLIVRAQTDYGLNFEANASGIIASAAVPVFAVCNTRVAAAGTIFMVHEAALWKWPGRETSSDIRAQNELMILLQDRYLGYLVDHSNLSLEEWQVMEKATTWFSAEKAKNEIGIVDEIK